MNLIFRNSLEKTGEQAVALTARVSIMEEEGALYVEWQEAQGDEVILEDWYRGESWEELLSIFRYRLAEKMGNGFVPVIDSIPMEVNMIHPGTKRLRLLQYYSESQRNEELYEELRQWRKDRSAQDNKVPYMVANNRLLAMISTFIPHNEKELLQIPGIGQLKLNQYGSHLLELTQQYTQPRTFPLDWVNDEVDEEQFRRWLFKQQEIKLKAAADELLNKKQLLKGIAKGHTLMELQEQLGQSERNLLVLLEQLDQDGYELLPMLAREIIAIPEAELEEVVQQFVALGDKYLKPVLEQVYTKEEYANTELDQLYTRLRLLRLYYRQSQLQQREVS